MVARRAGEPREASILVRSLRLLRPIHRWIGIPLALIVVVSGVTGVFLGWKKNVALLQPPTAKGASADLRTWRPIHEVEEIGRKALAGRLGEPDPAALELDRIDIRPKDGVAKVRFVRGDWEVQVDGATGEVRSIARRHADWIERIHDGSIIGQGFKVVTMTALGLGLVGLTVSGVWIWLGPITLRRRRRS